MSYDINNIFAKILRKEIPCNKIYENEYVLSFYDIKLISQIEKKVNIPIIASGGVGNLEDLFEGIKYGKASAVLAASIFHYGTHSIKEAKQYLDSKGIPVRI